MIKEIRGNLLDLAKDQQFDVIGHGANCLCTMGAGIAKFIAQEFPEALEVDRETKRGDKTKLGTYTKVYIMEYNFSIVNLYTQFGFGTSKTTVEEGERYEAIRKALQAFKLEFSGKRMGLPLIGAGLAGGNWDIIRKIYFDELQNEDVTIVYFDRPIPTTTP